MLVLDRGRIIERGTHAGAAEVVRPLRGVLPPVRGRWTSRPAENEAGTQRKRKMIAGGCHFPSEKRAVSLENFVALPGKGTMTGFTMAKKSARTPNAKFMAPVTPDAVLSAIVGSKPLPRTELTKKLWDYIKKNGLQDKKVRTQINADDKLKAVFGGKAKVSMFEMTKLVSGHVSS
ncbi:MAG: SWIB/MDM2 domain-containing protein [Opitutaceae bacterium]|nr:SWIB/MDM2 domain-containing protein [Opitutaceae bacterium]